LQDGEQSPGCSMTVPEKLRMAHKLVELGVDILEAGFPIASEGEYDAVTAVSKVPSVRVAALGRCCTLDVERAATIAILAVGIGLNTAVFTLTNATLFD
jgi:2-isopropylmalate synthase